MFQVQILERIPCLHRGNTGAGLIQQVPWQENQRNKTALTGIIRIVVKPGLKTAPQRRTGNTGEMHAAVVRCNIAAWNLFLK